MSDEELFPRPTPSLMLLWSLAACKDADSSLFDETDPEFAKPALSYCRRCPVKTLCLREMAPQEHWYDGVVGGIVWDEGVPVGGDKRLILPTKERTNA